MKNKPVKFSLRKSKKLYESMVKILESAQSEYMEPSRDQKWKEFNACIRRNKKFQMMWSMKCIPGRRLNKTRFVRSIRRSVAHWIAANIIEDAYLIVCKYDYFEKLIALNWPFGKK